MIPAPLKSEPSLFQDIDDQKGYFFTYSTVLLTVKKLLLLGSFNKDEQDKLSESGYHVYHILYDNKSSVLEKMKSIPLKEVSGIIIKKDDSKEFLKQINFIKQLRLHTIFPVILYFDGRPDINEVKKLGIIDEVITNLDNKSVIDFKIDFLSKFKKMAAVRFTLPNKIKLVSNIFNYLIRRSFDILISSILLLLISPILIVIAIIIKFESKGPIFYISKRAGKHYKVFPFLKFRTMVVDADKRLNEVAHLNQYSGLDKNAQFVKIKNDPRVTRFGSFLRNTSLDELPQFINVFLGHMSLVGNRPLPLYEAATLTNDSYSNRFNAPAGITGLWQILKRGQDDMSIEERLELDITYSKSNSLLIDLWIIVKTPLAMFQKSNV